MAIAVEFLNVLVPINNIDKVYPGGFDQFKLDRRVEFRRNLYYDDHLYREGAMNPMDIESMIERWESIGLIGFDGEKWVDFVVVDQMFGPTAKCLWLAYDWELEAYYKSETDPGKVIFPQFVK